MKIRMVLLSLMLMIVVQACATASKPSPGKHDAGLRPPPQPPLTSDQAPSKEWVVELTPSPKTADTAADEKGKGTTLPSRTGASNYGLLGASSLGKPQGPAWSDKEKQKIVLNFEKADVAEVTNQIFGDYLKLNYVADPALQGRISVYLEGDFTKDELLQMVTRVYEANNIAIVASKRHLLHPAGAKKFEQQPAGRRRRHAAGRQGRRKTAYHHLPHALHGRE